MILIDFLGQIAAELIKALLIEAMAFRVRRLLMHTRARRSAADKIRRRSKVAVMHKLHTGWVRNL